jgi:prepilin-type processing-associated H-X9-DG protein
MLRSKRRGFTTVEVLIVTGILASMGGDSFQSVTNKAYQTSCFNQLRQIFVAIQGMANDDESLPLAWFFPPDPPNPAREKYNLVNIMARNGVDKRLFICPSAPEAMKARGITYLYNDRLGKRDLDSIDQPSTTWLMMDANAVSTDKITPAHFGGCNVLYCDGHVKWVPVSALPILMTQAVDYRGN